MGGGNPLRERKCDSAEKSLWAVRWWAAKLRCAFKVLAANLQLRVGEGPRALPGLEGVIGGGNKLEREPGFLLGDGGHAFETKRTEANSPSCTDFYLARKDGSVVTRRSPNTTTASPLAEPANTLRTGW